MYCSNCNTEYPSGCRFCCTCGSVLVEKPERYDNESVQSETEYNNIYEESNGDNEYLYDNEEVVEDNGYYEESDDECENYEESDIVDEHITECTEIGIQKLNSYTVQSVDITRAKETKKYIQVCTDTSFKFCPDFTIVHNIEGQCFLYGDYVIMAFYHSDNLNIYKIKSQGRKASLLFSINCNTVQKNSLCFYKSDDGRYILSISKVPPTNP